MNRPALYRSIGITSLALLALMTWRTGAAGPATTDDLGGADRYLTHVSTDKPIYKLGETVYVRGVVLNAKSNKPLTGYAQATIEIKGPKGDTIAAGNANAQDSVIGFSWSIPEGMAGGEYMAKLTFPRDGHAPAERKFDIRAYRPPRLKSQIVFVRDGYGPGDTVSANLHTERAEGGIPKGAKVTAVARVDGAQVHSSTTRIDAKGNCSVSFPLPAHIVRGDGTLAMIIEDGGVVETASKTIPILLQTIDLTMYPEGGDLVAGMPTRVYLEAKTPTQKPADLLAAVYDNSGKEIVRFKTEHEGRGRFTFTPVAGKKYTLKVLEPSGIKTAFPLPAVKADGAVIAAVQEVSPKGQPVRLRIGKAKPGKVVVTLRQRETVVAETKIEFGKKSFWSRKTAAGTIVERSFKVPDEIGGVLVATVWAGDKPLAERLIFREPRHALNIKVTPDKKDYVTGDKVKLTITATDERRRPVAATVGVTVTDESVLEMIDKREQAPRLPVMVLLEDEVKEIADAHVYLDPKNDKAPLAVDLLLGTQGWRRFALVNTANFIATHGDDARRALALRMASEREKMRVRELAAMDEAIPMAAVRGAGPPRRHRKPGRPMPKAARRPPPAPPGRSATAASSAGRAGRHAGARAGEEAQTHARAQGFQEEGGHARRHGPGRCQGRRAHAVQGRAGVEHRAQRDDLRAPVRPQGAVGPQAGRPRRLHRDSVLERRR
ncbi:MAG: A-macroglobulin complement component, partial [Deltaproteobacteria bacterium]|nr:A-macroglobulin complement component [Deltaproteobacteria bacterium]